MREPETTPCPVCGGRLLPIRQGELRGVRCMTPTCRFNFADKKCPECGGDVVKAERPALSEYIVYCGNGHTWRLVD